MTRVRHVSKYRDTRKVEDRPKSQAPTKLSSGRDVTRRPQARAYFTYVVTGSERACTRVAPRVLLSWYIHACNTRVIVNLPLGCTVHVHVCFGAYLLAFGYFAPPNCCKCNITTCASRHSTYAYLFLNNMKFQKYIRRTRVKMC